MVRGLKNWNRCLIAIALLPSLWAETTPGSVVRSVPSNERAPRQPAELLLPRNDGANPHDPQARRFRVNAFEFSGNTLFDRMALKRSVEGFVDLELNLYDLGRAADAITDYYQQRGYPLARALIPAQRVVDGRVVIEVVEGRLGNIDVIGNRRYRTELLLAQGGQLQSGEVARAAQLESKLLRLNDLPGIKARALLRAGRDYGSSDLQIQIEEKPLSLDLSLNNAARKDIGQTRLDGNFGWNNPLRQGDRLALRLIGSQGNRLHYRKLAYELPLGRAGSVLSLARSKVDYRVGGAASALGLTGLVKTDEVNLSLPWLRSRQHDRSFALGYTQRQLSQQALGQPMSEVNIELASLSWNERWFDQDGSSWNWKLLWSGNGHDNRNSSRQDALRSKLEADLNATAKLNRDWDVFARINSVYSPQTLPDSDKFDVGGPDGVRAYRPSELRGSSGQQATLELRRNLIAFNRLATASLYADYGRVVYKEVAHSNSDEEIGGIGVGFTLYPSEQTTIKLQYARALTPKRADDGKKGRLWFALNGSF